MRSFEQQQDDTEELVSEDYSHGRKIVLHTAILEKVVPTAAKNIRGWASKIRWGEANPHQIEEMNRIVGEISGRIAS